MLNKKSAITAINRYGMLLTFPVQNTSEPKSLWSVAYPKSKMIWEWDDSGDNRLANLWRLREELSVSRKVIYTKWYQGRATFFSRELFTAMLARFLTINPVSSLSREARDILNILESDSPLSTKALKKAAGLQGLLRKSKHIWTNVSLA